MRLPQWAVNKVRRQELAVVDGPIIPRFNALELAHSIEVTLERAPMEGWTKVSLHLDLVDARMLAMFLRGGKR